MAALCQAQEGMAALTIALPGALTTQTRHGPPARARALPGAQEGMAAPAQALALLGALTTLTLHGARAQAQAQEDTAS